MSSASASARKKLIREFLNIHSIHHLLETIMEYDFNVPLYAKIPIDRIELKHLVISRSTKLLCSTNTWSNDDIGTIVFGCSVSDRLYGPRCVVVWVHPSGLLIGVIFLLNYQIDETIIKIGKDDEENKHYSFHNNSRMMSDGELEFPVHLLGVSEKSFPSYFNHEKKYLQAFLFKNQQTFSSNKVIYTSEIYQRNHVANLSNPPLLLARSFFNQFEEQLV
jgi:hypothetical protein